MILKTQIISLYIFIVIFTSFSNVNSLDLNKNDISLSLIKRKNLSYYKHHFISYSKVQYMFLNDQDIVLVDIRSNEKYNNYRIPGTINIPLYALKAKKYLRNQELILINEGFQIEAISKIIEQLKTTGFRLVKILRFGLKGWYQSGGKIEGSSFEIKKINRISPQIFFQDKNFKDVHVIEIIDRKKTQSNLIPNAIHISINKDFSTCLSKINDVVSKYHKDCLYIVIITNNKRLIDYLEKNIQPIFSQSIFYLDGGMPAYKKFLHNQTLIRNQQLKKNNGKHCKHCGDR